MVESAVQEQIRKEKMEYVVNKLMRLQFEIFKKKDFLSGQAEELDRMQNQYNKLAKKADEDLDEAWLELRVIDKGNVF